MPAENRSFYAYTTVKPNPGDANEHRTLFQYSLIGPYRGGFGRSYYQYTQVTAHPTWQGGSLYNYLNVTRKVSELTPLEVQLLNGSTWSIERILNPK